MSKTKEYLSAHFAIISGGEKEFNEVREEAKKIATFANESSISQAALSFYIACLIGTMIDEKATPELMNFQAIVKIMERDPFYSKVEREEHVGEAIENLLNMIDRLRLKKTSQEGIS